LWQKTFMVRLDIILDSVEKKSNAPQVSSNKIVLEQITSKRLIRKQISTVTVVTVLTV